MSVLTQIGLVSTFYNECDFFLYSVTGFSKGYAFVEYRSEKDANVAWRVSSLE